MRRTVLITAMAICIIAGCNGKSRSYGPKLGQRGEQGYSPLQNEFRSEHKHLLCFLMYNALPSAKTLAIIMTDPNQPVLYPILIRFAKTGLIRFVGHLDWQGMQHAIFLRAALAMGVGKGPSHRLKIKTSPPTPVGVGSMVELSYLLLTEPIYPDEAARRISNHCPDGISVVAAKDAGIGSKNPFGRIEATNYKIELGKGVSEETIGRVVEMLQSMKDNPTPEDADKDEIKPFWNRIIEISTDNGQITLMADQSRL